MTAHAEQLQIHKFTNIVLDAVPVDLYFSGSGNHFILVEDKGMDTVVSPNLSKEILGLAFDRNEHRIKISFGK